jgi:cysteine desulfurase
VLYDDPVVVYLDTAATTPVEPRVRDEVLRYLDVEFGNAGSRAHEYGRRARSAVEQARHQVAAVVGASRGDVIFTSGATESNNLAILGLAAHGLATNRRHVVSTAIEHHAVHEPLRVLAERGFTLTLVGPTSRGEVPAHDILAAVRPDTLLVSVMHVNNETGVVQPVSEIADQLERRPFFHVDAAQGYGKEVAALRHPRIDLISVSGHKIGAPKGIGALVLRRRDGARPPAEALMYGGGQERGLRPGTLPVALIAGLGLAAELALLEQDDRAARCRRIRAHLLDGLSPLAPIFNGDPQLTVPHIINASFEGLDADTVIAAWRDLVAVSSGAACTSAQQTCSHVLSAMRVSPERAAGAVRLSWQHDTPPPPVHEMVAALHAARGAGDGGRTVQPMDSVSSVNR